MELDAFIETHYGPLLRTAYLLTGDRSTAEDLLHEVLAKSWAYAQRGPIEQRGAFRRRCLVDDYVAT